MPFLKMTSESPPKEEANLGACAWVVARQELGRWGGWAGGYKSKRRIVDVVARVRLNDIHGGHLGQWRTALPTLCVATHAHPSEIFPGPMPET